MRLFEYVSGLICIFKMRANKNCAKSITYYSVIGLLFSNPYSCVTVECASNQTGRRRVRACYYIGKV